MIQARSPRKMQAAEPRITSTAFTISFRFERISLLLLHDHERRARTVILDSPIFGPVECASCAGRVGVLLETSLGEPLEWSGAQTVSSARLMMARRASISICRAVDPCGVRRTQVRLRLPSYPRRVET